VAGTDWRLRTGTASRGEDVSGLGVVAAFASSGIEAWLCPRFPARGRNHRFFVSATRADRGRAEHGERQDRGTEKPASGVASRHAVGSWRGRVRRGRTKR
jgi:hypothetical protein